MRRSRNCIFLSHCLLAQAVRAEGLVKFFPGPVTPVVQFCLENDINIIQMPCPEVLCPCGGIARRPQGKTWYENNGLRETARKIAQEQVAYMQSLIGNGIRVLAILGVEFSPACAVTLLNRGRRIERGQGIYIQELKTALADAGVQVAFIGVNQRALKKLEGELNALRRGGFV